MTSHSSSENELVFSGVETLDEVPVSRSQAHVRDFLHKYEHVLLGLAGISLFALLWGAASLAAVLPKYLIPPPQAVAISMYTLFASGSIVPHLWLSLQEFAVGFSVAAAAGVSGGILLGWYRRLYYISNTLISAFYSAPRIAFLPLFVVFFGVIGIWKTAATVFVMAFFPILINTLAGVRLCEEAYLKVGRVLGARDFQLVTNIVIPGSLPSIIAGLRLATSLGLTALVVGDLFGAQGGLGYLLFLYSNAFRTSQMIAVILVFSTAGILMNAALSRIESHFSTWRPSVHGTK